MSIICSISLLQLQFWLFMWETSLFFAGQLYIILSLWSHTLTQVVANRRFSCITNLLLCALLCID